MRTPSVYSGDTFRERLHELVPNRTFSELGIPFYCNSVRLEAGGSVFFGTPGFVPIPLLDGLYASCCLPGVFEPWEHEGFHYMDGGIPDAVPLRFAKGLQPDIIIAVDLTVKATFKAPDYKSRVLSTLYRSFESAEEVLVENALHMHADHRTVLIQPKVGHLHRFDFDDVAGVIRMGEEEALKVLTSHAAPRGS